MIINDYHLHTYKLNVSFKLHHVFLKASLKIVKLVKLTILPVLLRNSIDFFKANTWYNWFKRRGKCHHYV